MSFLSNTGNIIKQILRDPLKVQDVVDDQDTMQEIANSQEAMNAIANNRDAIRAVANSRTATDQVYENSIAISELDNSNLKESQNRNHNSCAGSDVNFRNDRVILINHTDRGTANRNNSSIFGRSNNDLPQTTNRVQQNTGANNGRGNTSSNIQFIDI